MRRLVPLAALLAAAGCGGSTPPATTNPMLPHGLAQSWARRADAVAVAAAAGQSCRAKQLAGALRDDVITAQGRVPGRLRGMLLQSVNGLADDIACTPPTRTVPTPTPKPTPPGHARGHHRHGRGNGQGQEGGD